MYEQNGRDILLQDLAPFLAFSDFHPAHDIPPMNITMKDIPLAQVLVSYKQLERALKEIRTGFTHSLHN